ncbi:amidase [Amycolatopsis azurea]|uniref:Amidase n=1 Tax=Amycolatopsis azurea DSM 43854 TaxID=1238180 RepID=M2NZW0_9PSEU|nr:amidase [Amycolatopsis azurea]EMD28254.1 amidase family protein [Amycolatopsis azurea DSM 43854]OOC00771.1 amidase [Amycolatopsis azurea DSM 43854]
MSELDAIGTAEAIRSGTASAREVIEAAIDRIEKLDPAVNAVVSTRFEQALAEVDRGLPAGPLHGVPVLIKDLGATVAGLPSTGGSRLFAERIAGGDSELVARYRRAGMVVLGMTNSAELGKNASTEPALFGPTRNPWRATHSAGGSSGGSAAAVAAGLVPVAHGSDGGGSIRIPAAMCGLFGLKPSRGRVSPAPAPASFANLVSVHHALTTTVRDSALLLDIAAGPLAGDAFSAPAPESSFLDEVKSRRRLRIGLVTGLAADSSCVAATERAAALCESLGHTVVPVAAGYDPAEVARVAGDVMGADLVVTVEDRLAELARDLRDDDLEPLTQVLYQHYRGLSAADLNRTLRRAQGIGWEVGRTFGEVDLLLTPTLARPTPRLGELDTSRPETIYRHAAVYATYTSVFNLTGMPAMSVPFGSTSDGLPLGVQFAGDLGAEPLLLGLAAQIEEAAPWQRTVQSVSP